MQPNTILTILSVIVGTLALIVTVVSIIAALTVQQARSTLSRSEKVREEFMSLKKEVDARHKKLMDSQEAELRKKYSKDLKSNKPDIRLKAINELSEIGNLTCILSLLNVIKNDQETDENRKIAEGAIVAIIGRTEEPLPETILREMEIPRRYIDIILSSCRQMIEKIQKRRVLKKSRTRKT